MPSDAFRERHTPTQRAAPLLPYIDPGFVNHRLVETFIGPAGIAIVNKMIGEIAPNTPDWNLPVRVDHIYTQVALEVCRTIHPPSLGKVVCQPDPRAGQIVSSTEVLEGSPDVYEKERVTVRWIPRFETDREVLFELSTSHVRSSTTKSQLAGGRYTHSFIAQLTRFEDGRLFFAPLIIGGPWLDPPPEGVEFDTLFLHYSFFQHFVEDIDEFQKVREVPDDVDWSPMQHISEKAFKLCLCELLGDDPRKDWGGERSDHFTPHLHLQGRRLTAAFLLKGPGIGFREMQPADLGRNGDQIFRLASEPAEMLIVQHCHNIGPAVRATLRAFAVQPHQARRYCLIDGRDSFRLLTAHRMVENALSLSRGESV